MPRLIFGCGYLGERVLQAWRALGEEVFVVTRSAEKANRLQQLGAVPIVADIAGAAPIPLLPACETALFAVGYDRKSAQSIEEVYPRGVAQALAALPAGLQRFIYVSSTGVYGDAGGDWIDETTPTQPQRAGGRAALAAEEVIRAHSLANRGMILRLAGIYGPDRIPRAADLIAGRPIDAPASGYLNLIHVDDAVRIILQLENIAPPKLYNISDGQPCLRADYYTELARLLGAPQPQFSTPASDSPAALRAAVDKRISNRKLMAEVTPTLQYPSYRAGLAAIIKEASE